MLSETTKFEHVTCSGCGKKSTCLKESDFIRDNNNNFICTLCYQDMLFPEINVYDRLILDYSSLPIEI
jgi:hypothetical protein